MPARDEAGTMTSATCSRVCDIGAAATPAVILPLLGLQGVELTSGSHGNLSSLPGDAVLVRISFDGPPEYPYLYAHFRKVTGRIGAKPRRPLDDPHAAIVASIAQVRVRPSAGSSIREIWLDAQDHASAG